MQTATDKHICQVAFSALNGPALRQWYADVFGLVKSGKVIFFPPSTARVQGVAGAWEKCSWLIDQQDYFQLEFFQFWKPRMQLKPTEWRPCDIGYNMVGIAVSNFDQVLRNVAAFSAQPPPRVTGEPGNRRSCVTDPEGNWVEIYERDPLSEITDTSVNRRRPEVPAVVRTLRASVPNLENARQAFADAMGLVPVKHYQLHTAQDEANWGLAGAKADYLLLRSDNFLLELVEYQIPAPRPWRAGYSIADQGVMNLALGYRSAAQYEQSFGRATNQGMRANGKVLDIGVFQVMYVNDRHGFSVEMLHARKPFWSISGFSSREPYVENEIAIDAPIDIVWQHLTDHARLGDWTLFGSRILRGGHTEPNGTGCVRELTLPLLRITEEVTDWEEGHHYAYRLRSGAPFRRHQGDVYVFEKDGATHVRWAIRFESWIPFTGKLIAWLLQCVLGSALRRLKRQLETTPDPASAVSAASTPGGRRRSAGETHWKTR